MITVGHLQAIMGLNTTPLDVGLAKAQASMLRAGKKMQAIGRTMTLGLTLPIALVGAGTIKMAADFEKSMSKIEGQVGIARNVVQGMRKDVLALAGPTGIAPQELADALFFVTSAGLRGADAMEVLRLSARGAAAGFGETKIVADLITSATNAYGIANLTAAEAMDTLAAAVREGKSEAVDIAGAMGQVLPIASNLGVSFQEVGASIAAMSRTGTVARTAVIQLRQMLASLLKPSQQSEAAFKSMGTSSAQMRAVLAGPDGLLNVLSFLREEMDSDSQAMVKAFPNVRALSGALDIMGNNAKDNIAIWARMAENIGDADKAFEAAANTTSFKFNQALANLKVVGIELGSLLLPIFNDLVGVINSWVKSFKGLDESTKKVILITAGLLAALGPVLFIIGKLVTLVVGLNVVLTATAIRIGAITLPVWAVIAAIVALGLVIVSIVDNWEALKERLSDWSWWKNMLIDMASFLVLKMMPVIQGFINTWNAFAVTMGKTPILFNTLDLLKGLDALRADTEDYKHEFVSLVDTIKKGANAAYNALLGLFPTGAGAAGGGAGGAAGGGATSSKQRNFGEYDISAVVSYGNAVVATMDMVNRSIATTNENLKETDKVVVELGVAMQNQLNSAFVELGDILGNLFSGDAGAGGFFGGLLKILAGFMRTFGIALVAAGVAKVAFENLMASGWGAIIAGVALIAASVVVASIGNKGTKPQGLATGGFVTQGGMFQLHKDEMIALPAGSAVTPAAGGMGGGNLSTTINLRQLVIQLDRERQRMGN